MGKVGKKGSAAKLYRQLVASHISSHSQASSHQGQGRVVKRTEQRTELQERQRLQVAHSRLDSMQDMFTVTRGATNIVSRPRGGERGRSSSHWHRGSRSGGSNWDRVSRSDRWSHQGRRGRGYSSQSSSSLRPSPSPLITGPDIRYTN